METEALKWWVNNYGWPGGFFIVHCIALWRILVFVKPYFVAWMEAQIKVTHNCANALTTLPTAGQVELVHDAVLKVDRNLGELHVKHDTNGDLLVEIHERVVKGNLHPPKTLTHKKDGNGSTH